jgi:hypothetical protein
MSRKECSCGACLSFVRGETRYCATCREAGKHRRKLTLWFPPYCPAAGRVGNLPLEDENTNVDPVRAIEEWVSKQ